MKVDNVTFVEVAVKGMHIMVLTPHFYAHIGAGLKVILPPVCKHTWFQTF